MPMKRVVYRAFLQEFSSESECAQFFFSCTVHPQMSNMELVEDQGSKAHLDIFLFL